MEHVVANRLPHWCLLCHTLEAYAASCLVSANLGLRLSRNATEWNLRYFHRESLCHTIFLLLLCVNSLCLRSLSLLQLSVPSERPHNGFSETSSLSFLSRLIICSSPVLYLIEPERYDPNISMLSFLHPSQPPSDEYYTRGDQTAP